MTNNGFTRKPSVEQQQEENVFWGLSVSTSMNPQRQKLCDTHSKTGKTGFTMFAVFLCASVGLSTRCACQSPTRARLSAFIDSEARAIDAPFRCSCTRCSELG